MQLDKTDIAILNLLQNDGKLNSKELGKQVGLSITPVYERVVSLEKQGIIKKYVAILDKKLIDKNLVVMSFVSLKSHSKHELEHFEGAVVKLNEVVEVYHVTGNYDYQLKVIVSNMEAYHTFIKNKLSTIHHIANVQSSFVMSALKDTTAISIDND